MSATSRKICWLENSLFMWVQLCKNSVSHFFGAPCLYKEGCTLYVMYTEGCIKTMQRFFSRNEWSVKGFLGGFGALWMPPWGGASRARFEGAGVLCRAPRLSHRTVAQIYVHPASRLIRMMMMGLIVMIMVVMVMIMMMRIWMIVIEMVMWWWGSVAQLCSLRPRHPALLLASSACFFQTLSQPGAACV